MRVINLKPNGVGRYDDVSPFIIADNKLELKIKLPAVNGEFCLVAEINDNKIKRLIPSNGELHLDGLSAGELRAEVKHYLKGELIKAYHIEPLLLKEVDGSLSAEPEIIAIIRQFDELKKILTDERKVSAEREDKREKDFKDYDEAINKKFEALNGTVNKLIEFAEMCIKNIPYIINYKFSEDLKNDKEKI